MAYMRSLSTRAKLVNRRFSPFSYVLHDSDGMRSNLINGESSTLWRNNELLQKRSFGSSLNNSVTGYGSLLRDNAVFPSAGQSFCRFLSTGEVADNCNMQGAGTIKRMSRGFADLSVPMTMNFSEAKCSVLKAPGLNNVLGIPKIQIPPRSTILQKPFSSLSVEQQPKTATVNVFRPLSPHLTIYKVQRNSTISISNRISAAFLAISVLLLYITCLKMGLICFTYEPFYQFFFYSAKLIPTFEAVAALALLYHIVACFL